MLREYFLSKHYDGFDEYRFICYKMAQAYVGKKRKLLITKDEKKDLQQDCILAFLESIKEFNPNKGRFVGLYKYKLKTLEQSFISRYTGIGMSYADYLAVKQLDRDIILNRMPYFDEYFEHK